MVMNTKDTRKLMNITKRVLTEQTTPNFPETLAKSINKQYGVGLKQKYSQDEIIKMIFDSYVKWMMTLGYDKAKSEKKASRVISYDEDFVPDVLDVLQ